MPEIHIWTIRIHTFPKVYRAFEWRTCESDDGPCVHSHGPLLYRAGSGHVWPFMPFVPCSRFWPKEAPGRLSQHLAPGANGRCPQASVPNPLKSFFPTPDFVCCAKGCRVKTPLETEAFCLMGGRVGGLVIESRKFQKCLLLFGCGVTGWRCQRLIGFLCFVWNKRGGCRSCWILIEK